MSAQLLQRALKTWYMKQNKWAINGPWFMGYLGLSVLTAVKRFWYLHSDVNYCSVRALAKRPASCERSHCWHCSCSPINCSNLRLDDTTAPEKLTYTEETLIYEIKEGTKMPWARGCPGCATVWSCLFISPVRNISLYMGGWRRKRYVQGGWPVVL